VEEVGRDVAGFAKGDLVVAPFAYSDGTCPHCRAGVTTSCVRGGMFGDGTIDGGQGQAVRVPLASSTLVKVPGSGLAYGTLKSVLTLADVMCTGHHAAVCAGVHRSSVVGVVGDGAVGLSAVLASARIGAERIMSLGGGSPDRAALASAFGATDIITDRGEAATNRVMELTGGVGVDSAVECVGTGESVATAFAIARPGSVVGAVGMPHGADMSLAAQFSRSVGWHGGGAPARTYIPELMPDVLNGTIDPGQVLNYETDLDHVADAYAAMDERRAIKSVIRFAAA
jgi:threonine dehydrogenase-like Zn-dependent dehydrogenase